MKALLITLALLSFQSPDTVYVTPSGKKYHTHKDCQYIRHSDTKAITLAEAQNKNLTICSRCKARDSK